MMREAVDHKQRREQGNRVELLHLAGRCCLLNHWESQTHSDASWFEMTLHQPRSLAKTTNHCALPNTYMEDIDMDANVKLRDLLSKVIRVLFLTGEAEEVH